jgi:hypothetical protein
MSFWYPGVYRFYSRNAFEARLPSRDILEFRHYNSIKSPFWRSQQQRISLCYCCDNEPCQGQRDTNDLSVASRLQLFSKDRRIFDIAIRQLHRHFSHDTLLGAYGAGSCRTIKITLEICNLYTYFMVSSLLRESTMFEALWTNALAALSTY